MRPIDADRLKAVLEKNFGHTGGASVLEQLIDEQPTIEPSTNCSEIPNNSDTVSRQQAIDAIVNTVSEIGLYDNSEVARYGATFRQHEIIDIIEGMPSAEPEWKKGKWIYHPAWETDGECGYECDQCGMGSDVNYDFCPRCGSAMRG